MTRDTIFLTTTIVIVLLAIWAMNASQQSFEREVEQSISAMTTDPLPRARAIIEVDFGSGVERRFAGNLEDGAYPLTSALASIAQEGGVRFEIQNDAVKSVNGVASPTAAWKIYQNNTAQDAPLSELTIAAGDTYTLRYEAR